MIPVSQQELPPLEFDVEKNELTQKVRMSSNKIGWLHTLSDKPGATFDIRIRDAAGRVRFERSGFGSEHEQAGELVNLSTLVGEEMEVEISNAKNVGKLKVFVN